MGHVVDRELNRGGIKKGVERTIPARMRVDMVHNKIGNTMHKDELLRNISLVMMTTKMIGTCSRPRVESRRHRERRRKDNTSKKVKVEMTDSTSNLQPLVRRHRLLF